MILEMNLYQTAQPVKVIINIRGALVFMNFTLNDKIQQARIKRLAKLLRYFVCTF